MRILIGLLLLAGGSLHAADAPQAVVQEKTHFSQVLGGNRAYRVLLPPAYRASQKRYPVIYWFHGYEETNQERDAEVAAYVAAHDVILVSAGPVDTEGTYPLYFPELSAQVDQGYRTLADRAHRGVTGFAMGGFMAFCMAAKFPDLISSASSFNTIPEAPVGPRDFYVQYRLEDVYGNYDGVRTRLVIGPGDLAVYYHRRLNALWTYARSNHESESFELAQADQAIPRTLDFHMKSFANPLPKPAAFSHADAYPNFAVWGWEVVSDRRQPGFTALEDVSSKGFRVAVREWIPGGTAIAGVKLTVTSAPLYVPGSVHPVTYLRLRDGNVRKASLKADGQGRLSFDLDGDAYQVGISAEANLVTTGYDFDGSSWATAGSPVKLRVKIANLGGARSPTAVVKWESSQPGVTFDFPTSRVFGLAPGESAPVPVAVKVADETRPFLKFYAVVGTEKMPVELPLFPPAGATQDFQIDDGRTLRAYQRGTQLQDVTLGEGNADGHAAPGETFAVLLPDGEALRAAELFTSDSCVDMGLRPSDSWADYEHTGVEIPYSLPMIRADCPPGHVVHMLARALVPNAPNHQVRYAAIEFPVWWRRGEEPKASGK